MDSNDTIENLSSINQDLFEEYEHLLSLCWDSATLSATFYVMQTMEMFIVPEITDLRPMFSYTHNLFRQLNPIAVMASGHESFLREIMNLLKFPESACAKDYSVNVVLNNPDMNKFVVFPQSEKSFPENHRRLFNVNVAGFENESEKKTYLNTNIPLHQKLVIQSAGNLLRYMEANWKSISPDNAKPIISSLKVFSLKSQVLIDDSSYLALEIFNTAPHPSGFMKGIKGTEQIGFSLYRLLNHCQSKQPTNDIAVLRKRYDTIEWCLDPRNADTVGQLRKVLRHVYEISRCFKKILEKPDKMYFWKIFRTSITNAFRVCELCRDSTEPEQNCGIVGDLRDAIECQVDIMVGFDAELDAMKAILRAAQVSVPDETKDIIRSIFPVYESCEFTLVPEMGFVVAIKSPMITPSFDTATSKSGVKFICHTKETYYYTTPSCRELNDKYGAIYNDICMREQQICTDLIAFITKNLPKLLGIIKSCAQLDCFIAMATVSGNVCTFGHKCTQEKGLNIVNGRHALMEECKTVIPNDVHISPSTGNLITIITAPNSAGKSIYLKQVGIIVYLAHIGCYVPAASAEIGTVNAIYSRIHSSDAVHQEISSFLYDLHQMANIIANSTERSLILIDEFGSGTTVNEGKSLLVACIEDLSRRGAFAPIAIFSTHYLDTVDLCEVREMLKEITIESHFDDSGKLQTTYKIIDGRYPQQNANELHNIRSSVKNLDTLTDERLKSILEKMNSSSSAPPDSDALLREKLHCAYSTLMTITNAFRVCELCRDSTEPEQNCGIVGDLRDAIECQVDIMVVFMAINEIIDIDEGMEQNKFITLEGFDAELDAMKAILRAAQVSVPDETKDIIRSIFPVYESCEFTLVPEMGFVVAIKSPMITPVSSDSSSTATSKSGVKFICHTKETYYYTTPSCRELNDKYGAIYNDICMREQQICTDLIAFITKNLPKLLGIIKSCAQLDCFIAMATVSGKRMYVRPQMHAEKGLNIVNGRHALMEECKTVIPNDVHISPSTGNLITIITAPNSAGKSIYLKQVGIIVYLAHIGCYVPAASAEIGTVNAIYSRIHSSDAVHQEISSFLYDLHQMANIIANSTERSLILIDEFGSGTTVNEGKSLLVACIEDLSRRGAFAPIAIFSTHYLDTVDLCEVREMLKEITIESRFDDSGKLQTTYKIIDGRYPQQNANELHNIRSSVKNLDTLTDERLKSILEKIQA
uniref:Putative mismatch repair atpase msh5 muts family n=1 Tax=Lutzomyia longipalpis TaxID=7200 RepID=A0A1B0GIV7_LUTLO